MSLLKLDEILAERYSHILAMRQFKTRAEIKEALKPGDIYFETASCYGKPAHVSGPYTVLSEWAACKYPDLSPVIRVHRGNFESSENLADLQDSLVRAVFTNEARARAYYDACRAAYEQDDEWRSEIARQRRELGWIL